MSVNRITVFFHDFDRSVRGPYGRPNYRTSPTGTVRLATLAILDHVTPRSWTVYARTISASSHWPQFNMHNIGLTMIYLVFLNYLLLHSLCKN